MANIEQNALYIKYLVDSLSTSELKMLRKYLTFFEDGKKSIGKLKVTNPVKLDAKKVKGGLSLDFLNIIAEYNGEISSWAISSYLAEKFTSNQRRNLSSRLLKKIHDFLLLEVVVDKSITDPVRKIQHLLLRNIAVLDLLLAKGMFDEFLSLSSRMQNLADNYERYNEAKIIIQMRMAFLVNRIKSREYQKLLREYEIRKVLSDEVFKCNSYAIQIQQKFNEKIDINDIMKFLRNVINELSPLQNDLDSDTWRVSYNLILLEYAQQTKAYDDGNDLCEKIIQIYKSNKYITSSFKMGNSYRQLSNNQLLGSLYSSAIDSAKRALSYFKSGTINWVGTNELILLGYYYSKDYVASTKIVETVLTLNPVQKNKNLVARWEYYKSILLYKSEKYKEAYINVQKCNILMEDKEGWGIGIRIFITMILIEQKNFDSLMLEVENIRKYISRSNKENSIRKRYLIIYRIIASYVNLDYDWNEVYRKNKKLIYDLQRVDKAELNWEVRSPELIRFDVWLMEKMQPA